MATQIPEPRPPKRRLLKPIELKLKFWLADASRLLLRRGRPDLGILDGRQMERVLFLRIDKIGDMVITFPAIDALKEHFPHLRISILGSPTNWPLIADDPRFDEIFLYRKSPRDLQTIANLRSGGFDCVLDTMCNDSVTTLLLTQMIAGAAPRVGLAKKKHRPYYDYSYSALDGRGLCVTGEHIMDDTLHLLDPFGIDLGTVDRYRPPHITPAATERVSAFLGTIGASSCDLLLGFNLSAGKVTSFWPLEKVVAVCRAVLDLRAGAAFILSTAPQDREGGAYVQREVGGRCYHAPAFNLIEACALVSRLDLLISPDTSMIHIARSFRVPVVGLYNRNEWNTVWWGPYRQPGGIVTSDDEDSAYRITVDQVVDRIHEVLATQLPGEA